MRVTDEQLAELRSHGFVVVRDFLNADELREAQAGLWESGLQRPEEFFAETNAEGREKFRKGPRFFADTFPFASLALNKLLLHPDLIDACERFLGADVWLTIGHMMSKYAGVGKDSEWDPGYDQRFHRDYGNHTLVVPRADRQYDEVTTFLYLSDVTHANGATALVPRKVSDNRIPLGYNAQQGAIKSNRPVIPEDEYARLQQAEERAEGPAGSLLLYTYDGKRDAPWIGKHLNWGAHGLSPEVNKLVAVLAPAQRECLDFPAAGHDYWNEQTIEDVQLRYPEMDMEPYRRGLRQAGGSASAKL